MIKDLVSVVIPIYNKEESLSRCVDSAIKQTYHNLEVILVNDGSIDQSEYICKKYCDMDSRVHYYEQENRGPSAARNLGVEVANGEWIVFVDADDYIDEHTCEIAVDNAKKWDADVVLWGSEDCCKDGKTYIRLSEESTIFWNGKEEVRQLNRLMALGHLGDLRANYILDGPCCKMIHHDTVQKCSFPDGIDYGEDSCFCAMLYDAANRVKWINEILYHRITTEGSLSNRKDDSLAYRKAKFIKWLIDYWASKLDDRDVEIFVINNVATIYSYYADNSELPFKKQRILIEDALSGVDIDRYFEKCYSYELSKKTSLLIECYWGGRMPYFLLLRYIIRPLKRIYHFIIYRVQ